MNTPRRSTQISNLKSAIRLLAAVLLALLGTPAAQATTLIWDADLGTTGAQDAVGTFTWAPADAKFWNGTSDVATTNNITTDIAQFGNGGTLASSPIINVSTQSINGLIYGATTTSGYTLTATSAKTLTIGTGGISLLAGAQATTLGDANLSITLGAAQTWSNASTSLFTVGGAVNNGSFLLTLGTTGSTTISGVISGAGGLTTGFGGTFTLSNTANTYTGKTIMGAGTNNVSKLANFGANSSLGQGTLNVGIQLGTGNTGILNYTGSGDTSNRNFTIGSNSNTQTGGGTIQNNGANGGTGLLFNAAAFNTVATTTLTRTLTLGGSNTDANEISGAIVNNNPGLIALTKAGTGTWKLSGANTYTGNTTVSAGTLNIAGTGSLYSTLGSGTATVTVASGAQILLSGTANNALNFTSAETWVVSGTINSTGGSAQSFAPNVTLNNGILSGIAATGGNAAYGAFYVSSNTTITANGASNTINAANIGTGNLLTLATPLSSDALSVSSAIGVSGGQVAGSVTKTGLGSVTLSGNNTYSGATTLAAGSLQAVANAGNTSAGVSSALSQTSALTMSSGTTLQLRADSDTIFAPASVNMAGSGTVTYNYDVAPVTGGTTGKVLTLANQGQWGPGGTADIFNLTGGAGSGYTFAIGSGSLGTGAVNIYNNSTINSNTAGVTFQIAGGLNFNYSPYPFTLALGGPGNITLGALLPSSGSSITPTFGGSGTITLTGVNGFGAATGSITSTGTLALNNAGALTGLSALNVTSAVTLDNTTAAPITISATPAYILNSDIAFTGTQSLNLGTGTVSLGTVAGATRTITVNGNTLTVGGVISDGTNGTTPTTALTKAGAGTLTLSAANTYTGTTTINGGTLELNNTIGTITYVGGTISINNGSTLKLSGGNQYWFNGKTVAFGAGGGTFDTGTSTNMNIVTGASGLLFTTTAGTTSTIGGSMGINLNGSTDTFDVATNSTLNLTTFLWNGGTNVIKQGGGTLVVSGANSYGAATTLAAGTLQAVANAGNTSAGVSSALSPNSALTMNSGSTLQLRADSDTIFAPSSVNMAGSGSVTYNYDVAPVTGGATGKVLTLANQGQWGPGATADTFNLTGGAGSGYTFAIGSGSAGTGAVNIYNDSTINSNTAGVTFRIAGGLNFNYPYNFHLALGGPGNITLGAILNPYGNNTTPTFGGSGTITLTGVNAFGGATGSVTSTGTLALNNADALTGLSALNVTSAVTLDNTTAAPITISATPAYTLNSDIAFTGTQSLNLGTGTVSLGTVAGATRTVTVNGNTLTVGGVISDGTNGTTPTTALTKAGAGTLTLSGANTYTGTTTISAGTLQLATAGTLGNGSYAGTIAISPGATLQDSSSAGQTLSGAITGGGAILKDTNTSDLSLSNIGNTYSGTTTVSAGRIIVSAPTHLSSGATSLVQSGTGEFLIVGTAGTYTNPFNLNGTGYNEGDGQANIAGAIRINNANTLSGTITLAGNSRIGSLDGTPTISGKITGGFGIEFYGMNGANNSAEVFTISNATNDYTGATTIINSNYATANFTGVSTTLKLGASNVIPDGASASNVVFAINGTNDNATDIFDLNGFSDTINGLTVNAGTFATKITNSALGASVLTIGANNTTSSFGGLITEAGSGATLGLTKSGNGTLTLSGANTYTGATTVSSGTLTAGVVSVANVSGAFGNNSAVTMANIANANLNLAGFNTQIGSLAGGGTTGGNVILGSGTLTVGGDNTSPAAYAGVISGNGGLTKIGTGTQTLTGTNTHNGATTISTGKLVVNGTGSINNSSGVTINGATANLAYNSSTNLTAPLTFTQGKISGTNWGGSLSGLTIGANQTISPGNSPGTTTSVAQTWAGSGTYQWEINNSTGIKGVDPGWDWLNLSGALTQTATSGNKFIIDITGLTTGNVAGAVSNWNAANNSSYIIASAAGGIVGFNANSYTLNLANFTNNNTSTGTWSIAQSTNDIVLNYIVSTPATGTLTLNSLASRVLAGTSVSVTGSLSNAAGATNNLNITLTSTGTTSVTGITPASGTVAPGATNSSVAGSFTSGVAGTTNSVQLTNTDGAASPTTAVSNTVTNTSVASRLVTNATTLDLGLLHTGAAVSTTSNATGNTYGTNGTGAQANTEDASITAFTGAQNGITLTTSATTLTTNSGVSGSLIGNITGSGTVTGTYSLTTTRELSGSQTSPTISYTSSVFDGNATWTGAGNSWGTGASNNWTAAGGVNAAPGTFAGFTTVDSATFNGAGANFTANLNGTSPSIKTLNFASATSYTIAPGTSGTLTFDGGAAINVTSGSHTISAPVLLNSNLAIVGSASTQLTVSGQISGGNALTVTGPGTTVLSNLTGNTYSGGTTVNGNGILLAKNTSGSATGTGAVSVAAGSTLGGTGLLTATSLNITSGGPLGGALMVGDKHGAGSTVSVLTVAATGSVTMGGMLQFDLFSKTGTGIYAPSFTSIGSITLNKYASINSNDLLNFNSASSFSVTGALQVSNSGGINFAKGDTWQLVNWTTVPTTVAFSDFTLLPSLGAGLAWDIQTDQSNFSQFGTITVVPEPSRAILMLLGAAGLLMRRRRKGM